MPLLAPSPSGSPESEHRHRPRRTGRAALAAAVPALLGPAAAFASPEGAATGIGHRLPLAAVAPFVGLLLAIALLPLAAPAFWERHRNKGLIALLFGLPAAIWTWTLDPTPVVHELWEYVSFIALLGSLFVASGGLVLRGDLAATPRTNTLFLGGGALLANLIGTTGASMLLIRPLLRTNSQRKNTSHLPVFFIFLVANIGGALTPLGDPPLFLGFLRGVPFFWTLHLLPIWATTVALVLGTFFFVDRRAYAREEAAAIQRDRAERTPLELAGKRSLLALAGIVGAVFLPSPAREGAMVLMGISAALMTPRSLHEENGFTYGPIIEVALLFLGIFLAMVPALEILRDRGAELGITEPWQFFWATGGLSSFLDNAPTYLTFVSLAQSLGLKAEVVGVPTLLLKAVSAGAVFMGANSYIGNGPNFMVKSIADENKVMTPSFFGYLLVAAVYLLPVFVLVTFLFFV
jgi:Na+/H+ antiporter NhaD/arsenite permease-like protein